MAGATLGPPARWRRRAGWWCAVSVEGEARSRANLIRGASDDPDIRARQTRHLKRGNQRHGALSEGQVQPLAQQHFDQLVQQFPNADRRLLEIQSRRAAQIDLLTEWMHENGLLHKATKRRGDVWGAVAFAEKLASAFERQHLVLEQQREAGTASPHDALAEIVRELAEGDDDDGEQDAAVELPDSPAIDGEGDGRG